MNQEIIDRLQHALDWCARHRIERERSFQCKQPQQPTPRKSPPPKPTGWIYLLECLGYHKVGISATSVKKRVAGLQTGNPFPIVTLASWPCYGRLNGEERSIHALLKPYRVRGEWFKLPPEMVQHLISHR